MTSSQRRLDSGLRATRRDRGFTLVELVIVGALIALFSGLAVFSIQTQFRNNQRKATIYEARQIASAMDMANLDTGIFPRVCWLIEGQAGLDFIGTRLFGAAGAPQIYNYMEQNGRDTFGKAFDISQNWRGPYASLSPSRAGLAQGVGGIATMILPELSSFPTGDQGFRWPADPWGNPYTVYMLDIVPSTETLRFINEDPEVGINPTSKGNFINAVVSYGPNRVPGGGDAGPAADISDVNGPAGLCLYVIGPGFTSFTHLDDAGFLGAPGLRRANAWTRAFYLTAGFSETTLQPAADDINRGVGITDSGSDDIIYEF
ncbi:MAG: prepilin-type N-terminal cleavage/methylation domain-containing protein [Candidatus Sumerlaeia bacterium]|nr:prepilin-type N-terminal cleavage/methylation domain-containing protein [Candidatus Sumerlaeia bacterium]